MLRSMPALDGSRKFPDAQLADVAVGLFRSNQEHSETEFTCQRAPFRPPFYVVVEPRRQAPRRRRRPDAALAEPDIAPREEPRHIGYRGRCPARLRPLPGLA